MNKLIFVLLLMIALFLSSCVQRQGLKIQRAKLLEIDSLESWNSKRGQELLLAAEFKNDFFQLASYFQPQINPLYCGIATSVIILNATNAPSGTLPAQPLMEVNIPKSAGGGIALFNTYSQYTLLNEKTNSIKDASIIGYTNADTANFNPGVSLQDLKGILNAYGLSVELHYARNMAEFPVFLDQIKASLVDDSTFIVCNFYGKKFKAKTGGHISPIVAFESKTKSILVMDVAGHKNPWYWVSAENLFKAMNTGDGDNYRGWLVINK